MLFFRLSSLELALILFGVVLGTTLLGIVAGRRLRAHVDSLREPFGVVQAALAGLVALISRSASRWRSGAMQTVHVSALNNRVPSAVLVLEVVGAAVALGVLAMYLAILQRGLVTVVLASAFVSVLLPITFDLDRPVRGLVRVPDTPLVDLRASMELPPAARAPDG
jgi:hypothetical protein